MGLMGSPIVRRCRDALAVVGLVVLLVSVTPLVSWWARALAGPWRDPNGRTLIVLVGDSTDNSLIGRTSYLRANYAVRAYQTDNFERILITGDPQSSTDMASFMEASGVPEDRIILETNSFSTHDSAVNTAALLAADAPATDLVLLTSDFHMWRAHRAFGRAGVSVDPRPIPDALKRASRWQDRWSVFEDLIVESVKIAYYAAKGWI